MGILSFFRRKESGRMPIGMALDILENASRRFPHQVIRWIEENSERAHKVDGLVDSSTCSKFKNWDGPYSITVRSKYMPEQVTNMFFADLRRDVREIETSVLCAGEAETAAVKWVCGFKNVFDREKLADEIVKRKVRADKLSALEFVDLIIEGDASGLFDDLHAGYADKGLAEATGKCVVEGLLSNTEKLIGDKCYTDHVDSLICERLKAKTLIAANLYAFATTILSSIDCCERIGEFKEVVYGLLAEDFPEFRKDFNMVFVAYEHTPQEQMELLTSEVSQAEKMPAAFLLITGCVLIAQLWGEDSFDRHKDFLGQYIATAKDFYRWMKSEV